VCTHAYLRLNPPSSRAEHDLPRSKISELKLNNQPIYGSRQARPSRLRSLPPEVVDCLNELHLRQSRLTLVYTEITCFYRPASINVQDLLQGYAEEIRKRRLGIFQEVANSQETKQDGIVRGGTVRIMAPNEMKDLRIRRSSLDQEPNATKAVLEELFSLLEEYGPAWYTEEHHKRIVAALLIPGTRTVCDTYRLGMTR